MLHHERLTPPWWGWLLAAFWASTLGVAYGYAISFVVGVAVFAGLFAVATVGLVRMSALVEVTGGTGAAVEAGNEAGLRAGHATLPASAIGAVTVLDADAARRRRGVDADSRAFVLLRGWVRGAVTVQVNDPRDPTPYWFVSTRRAEALASALRAVAPQNVTGSSE